MLTFTATPLHPAIRPSGHRTPKAARSVGLNNTDYPSHVADNGHPHPSGVDWADGGYRDRMAGVDVPDEVPVADAVEQHRDAVEPPLDEEAPEPPVSGVPLEAPDADWQEQTQTVDTGPDLDEPEPPG